ncbi:hypothetical protein [Pseudomonas sp. RIT-PI-AD]|uniref:hypothetical protein n=1 Tax=Pseudomonas sp. RIT-PI-AD TaxID=3035294 RepID=UPI0021D85374|nr:hypothetical protein [Pseudomonas sp. RIT-PI-AD]
MAAAPETARRRHARRCAALACGLAAMLLGGCQGTRERMLAEGYPAPFVEGFEAGCSSGRQAASGLERLTKDVPRYLAQPVYAQGWDDGFRQCQGAVQNALGPSARDDWRDRAWRRHVDQAMAQALRHR